MEQVFIKGNCIDLRPAEPRDAVLFATCNNSPEARQSFFTHTPCSLHNEEKRVAEFYRPGGDYIPLVICKKDLYEIGLGVTAFHRLDYVSRAAVFSICIPEEKNWGYGYGQEATALMMEYGFDILNLNRIQLHVWEKNERAIRAYGKTGFQREGLLREAMYHNGEYCNFMVMGLLAREWRSMPKRGCDRQDSSLQRC